MPVQVRIYINNYEIKTLHIGRIEGDVEADSLNTYKVVSGEMPTTVDAWMGGETFEHRYGDGVEICVGKAIDALTKAGKVEIKG
jgi:hypothetical protein